MHHSVWVTSMAKMLVLITVPYPCVTTSESGLDRFLFTVACFVSNAQSLFKVWNYFIEFFFWFPCSKVPDKSYQGLRETGAEENHEKRYWMD